MSRLAWGGGCLRNHEWLACGSTLRGINAVVVKTLQHCLLDSPVSTQNVASQPLDDGQLGGAGIVGFLVVSNYLLQ